MNPMFDNVTVSTALLGLIQILFIIGGLLYIVFGFIIIRQITVMKKTLITALHPEISIVGWVHLALTIALLMYFIFGL